MRVTGKLLNVNLGYRYKHTGFTDDKLRGRATYVWKRANVPGFKDGLKETVEAHLANQKAKKFYKEVFSQSGGRNILDRLVYT